MNTTAIEALEALLRESNRLLGLLQSSPSGDDEDGPSAASEPELPGLLLARIALTADGAATKLDKLADKLAAALSPGGGAP